MGQDRVPESGSASSDFPLDQVIDSIAPWLPTQRPLKDFIHHNPLHAFQNRPFHEALALAEELYGARNYLDLEHYRELFKQDVITERALMQALESHTADRDERFVLRGRLLNGSISNGSRAEKGRPQSHRQRWLAHWRIDPDSRVHPVLFRLLASHLDQGIALWPMPHAELSLWDAMAKLVNESVIPLPELSHAIGRRLLSGSPDQAILHCLERLVGDRSQYAPYLLSMLLAHPGWSGMVRVLEEQPGLLLERRKIRLKDAIALELVIELNVIMGTWGGSFSALDPVEAPRIFSESMNVRLNELQTLQKIWHEAWEWSLYTDVLDALVRNSRTDRRRTVQPDVQAFFCIDDRECSLRRHLEEVDPGVETWSVAGFFGIDFLFQGPNDRHPTKLCPVPLQPQHLVREKVGMTVTRKRPGVLRRLHLAPSNTLARGWLISQTLGLWHSLRLAALVFKPTLERPVDDLLSCIEPHGELDLLRTSDVRSEEGFLIGYSVSEMADRVQGVLKSSGCVENFAPLVLMISHGATSVNNPYFAAYDCGACSGRPGAHNARAFAAMANHPEVRSLLASRGLHIPPSCHFVGAFHDTTRDDVSFFDGGLPPATHQAQLDRFKLSLEHALKRNAKERCRRFHLADPDMSLDDAHKHVKRRAASIFEPRPELNHATNALCLVGRRDLSRGLFLDRRAFLNSYNPQKDPDGSTLAGILAAVVPVCGGINLEYYFSKMDPGVYGAGSKLPQNVVGLIGLAHGVEGDLLTGLPTQMTEMHDPLRLMVIVEQEPEIVMQALTAHPGVAEWVFNEWLRLGCISPGQGEAYVLEKGRWMRSPSGTPGATPDSINSLHVIAGARGNLPVHLISGETR